MNKRIVKDLYKAQLASDAGKGLHYLAYKGKINKSYSGKDAYIYDAIQTILHKRDTGFSFYVTDGKITPFLVYFNCKLGKENYQVSFHSYDYRLAEYFCKDTHKVSWDEKSSRDTVEILYRFVIGGGEL